MSMDETTSAANANTSDMPADFIEQVKALQEEFKRKRVATLFEFNRRGLAVIRGHLGPPEQVGVGVYIRGVPFRENEDLEDYANPVVRIEFSDGSKEIHSLTADKPGDDLKHMPITRPWSFSPFTGTS